MVLMEKLRDCICLVIPFLLYEEHRTMLGFFCQVINCQKRQPVESFIILLSCIFQLKVRKYAWNSIGAGSAMLHVC